VAELMMKKTVSSSLLSNLDQRENQLRLRNFQQKEFGVVYSRLESDNGKIWKAERYFCMFYMFI
jgi:hypothetical protein